MHGQVKSTTQERLDHYLKKFVEAVNEVRRLQYSEVMPSDAMRKARDIKAKAETEVVKAYDNHHRER